MKNTIYTLLVLILSAGALNAQQNRLVVYAEEGEKFELLLNGKSYTEEPVARIEIEDLTQPQYRAVITFEDASKGVLKNTVYTQPETEMVYKIKMNRKGKYVMRLFSSSELLPAEVKTETPAPPDEKYRVDEEHGKDGSDRRKDHAKTGKEKEEAATDGDRQSTRVDITMPDGSSMSVGVETQTHQSVEEEQTSRDRRGGSGRYHKKRTRDHTSEEPEAEAAPVYVEGYTGTIGCPHPISNTEAESILKSIQAQTFSDSRMKTAKRALNNKCITVENIGKLLGEFTFENSKIELAKYAFERTYDRDNYFQLYNLFTFESSIDEIESYIENR